MVHNDNIKTFQAISKHLEMEDEHQKSSPFQVWHLLIRVANLRAKGPFVANRPRKVYAPLKTVDLRKALSRSKTQRITEARI